MAKKPRRDEVERILKNLLESEIPEIQAVARQLADRIKKLEEHSIKLQDYVAKIESLTEDEADEVIESRIGEIVDELEKALGKRRQKPSEISASKIVPTKKVPAVEIVGNDTEAEEEEEVSGEIKRGLRPPKYTTPEGMVIRKSRH
jgi:cell division ATPase FtsA